MKNRYFRTLAASAMLLACPSTSSCDDFVKINKTQIEVKMPGVLCAVWISDHQLLLGGLDSAVQLYDLSAAGANAGPLSYRERFVDLSRRQTVAERAGAILAIARDPAEKPNFFVAGGTAFRGELWDLSRNRICQGLPPATAPTVALGFDRDLIVARDSALYRLFETDGEFQAADAVPLAGPSDQSSIKAVSLARVPSDDIDGRPGLLAVGLADGRIQLRTTRDLQLLEVVGPYPAAKCAQVAAGKRPELLAIAGDRILRRWSVTGRPPKFVVKENAGGAASARWAQQTNGKFLVSAQSTNITRWRLGKNDDPEPKIRGADFAKTPYVLAADADGRRVVAFDGRKLWLAEFSGSQKKAFSIEVDGQKPALDDLTALMLSDDGQQLAVGFKTGAILAGRLLSEAANSTLTLDFVGNRCGAISALRFMGSDCLAVASRHSGDDPPTFQGALSVWRVDLGKRIYFAPHKAPVLAVDALALGRQQFLVVAGTSTQRIDGDGQLLAAIVNLERDRAIPLKPKEIRGSSPIEQVQIVGSATDMEVSASLVAVARDGTRVWDFKSETSASALDAALANLDNGLSQVLPGAANAWLLEDRHTLITRLPGELPRYSHLAYEDKLRLNVVASGKFLKLDASQVTADENTKNRWWAAFEDTTDHAVLVFGQGSSELQYRLNGHTNSVNAAQFDEPDSVPSLVTAGQDSTIRGWNLQTGGPWWPKPLATTSPATALVVNRSEAMGFAGLQNGDCLALDLEPFALEDSGSSTPFPQCIDTLQTDSKQVETLTWMPCAGLFIGHKGGAVTRRILGPTARLGEPADAEQSTITADRHGGPIHAVAVSDQGAYVVTGDGDGIARAWRKNSVYQFAGADAHPRQTPIPSLQELRSHGPVYAVVPYATDSFIVGGHQRRVMVWPPGEPSHPLGDDPIACTAMAISHDKRRLAVATAGERPEVTMYRVLDGRKLELIGTTAPLSQNVYGLAFDPTTDRLAAIALDGTLYLWEAGDLEPKQRESLAQPESPPTFSNLAWSPDGKRLAVTSVPRSLAPAGTPPSSTLWIIDLQPLP